MSSEYGRGMRTLRQFNYRNTGRVFADSIGFTSGQIKRCLTTSTGNGEACNTVFQEIRGGRGNDIADLYSFLNPSTAT